MTYKDKNKQREANRRASKRYRRGPGRVGCLQDKTKGMTNEGMMPPDLDIRPGYDEAKQGITDRPPSGITQGVTVIPDLDIRAGFDEAKIQGSTKRGKDIKCFADLPPDVQITIQMVSDTDEELEKRTAAAIRYQHLFPNRYHSTTTVCSGVVTGKPGDADYNGVCMPEWRAERGR